MLHTVRAVLDAHGARGATRRAGRMTEEHPRFAAARDALGAFAELEKSPDYLHTYRITPVSIWNAAALGPHGRARSWRARGVSRACPCRAT
jgi:hypothetical protein